MGCGSSTPLVVETPDDVLQNCQVRRSHIHDAIKYRRKFSIAHAAYTHSLKNVGSALRHFALGEFFDADISPRPSQSLVLALPPPSAPSVGGVSPPPGSSLDASFLSPPHRGVNVNVNTNPPSDSPMNIPISPALSPIRLPTSDTAPFAQAPPPRGVDRSPSPTESALASPHAISPRSVMPPHGSFRSMASTDRGSEFSAPYYSPSRDDLDNALIEYNPVPPSSLLADSSWFNTDVFTPPLIPEHLQEQRRMKRQTNVEQENNHGAVHVEDLEGIPDLEEVEHKEDGTTDDVKDPPSEKAMMEEAEKRVAEVDDEKFQDTEVKSLEEKSGVPDNIEEISSDVASISTEKVASESTVFEMPEKEPAAAILLKEKNMSEAMQYIDDLFERAFQCGRDVSRMLETQSHHQLRMNSMKDGSNVFNAITSHWSRRTLSMMGEDSEDDDLLECGMSGSHASTLERLYAWERKLSHEVKEGKQIRTAFDMKFKQIHNFDARGGNPAVRDKLKASLKELDTRLMVAIRAIRAASLRIQELTNEELYPQLCEMLGGLVSMWSMLEECHNLQAAIALEMQTFEDSVPKIDATETAQKQATVVLRHELENLQGHFQGWIWSQAKYIMELDEWMRRCYDVKEPSKESTRNARMSMDRTEKAPIFHLLREWRKSLGALDSPQQAVVNELKSFATGLHFLEENQSTELRLRRQVEKSSRRLDQQASFLDKLEKQSVDTSKAKPASTLQAKRARLDKYKSRADMGRHDLFAAVQVRKDLTLDLLKQQLPKLFASMSAFTEAAKKMYETVKEEAEAAAQRDKQKDALRLTLQ